MVKDHTAARKFVQCRGYEEGVGRAAGHPMLLVGGDQEDIGTGLPGHRTTTRRFGGDCTCRGQKVPPGQGFAPHWPASFVRYIYEMGG